MASTICATVALRTLATGSDVDGALVSMGEPETLMPRRSRRRANTSAAALAGKSTRVPRSTPPSTSSASTGVTIFCVMYDASQVGLASGPVNREVS